MASTSVSLSSSVEKLEERHDKSCEMAQSQQSTAAPLRAVRAATQTLGLQAKPQLTGGQSTTASCLYEMEDSLLPTVPTKSKSGAVTPLPALPGSRATASPVLGGGGVWREEDVLDDTGVFIPATAALT